MQTSMATSGNKEKEMRRRNKIRIISPTMMLISDEYSPIYLIHGDYNELFTQIWPGDPLMMTGEECHYKNQKYRRQEKKKK